MYDKNYDSGVEWKAKLDLWPYAAILVAVIGILYKILASGR